MSVTGIDPGFDNGGFDSGGFSGGAGPPGKRASQIARLLEADVIARGWPIGESLGTEQSLQHRFAVSRSVLREAVRLVEHHQVARMRRGAGGGLFVTVPDAAPATRAIVIYLQYLGTTVDDLFGARLLLEPLAATVAAERIDEAGIDRLRTVLHSQDAADTRPAAPHHEFHTVLGALTKNPVLQLFVDVLIRLTSRYAADSRTTASGGALKAMARTDSDHARLAAAVTAGDFAAAKALSDDHVRAVFEWLREHHDPAQTRKRLLRRRSAEPDAAGGKRAEVLAAAIGSDIAAQGWRFGSVFGTEGELLVRYGVSRPALREAVRLLEYHSVARMRRGPGGGLVVTQPQAQPSINTIALYLDYRQPSRDDLRLVRDAIEINNVAKVVGRRADADVLAFLADPLTAPPPAGPLGEAQPDLVRAATTEYDFHSRVAELAGNSVLQLFQRILVELLRRRWSGAEQLVPDGGDEWGIHAAHAGIISAIRDGDDSVARHRTRRHLEAVTAWWL